MRYNKFERSIARILDKYPTTRKHLKYIYQRANYIISRLHYRPTLYLDPRVQIKSVLNNDSLCSEFFFGYYDKCPWSFDCKYYLVNLWSKNEKGNIKLGIIDVANHNMQVVDSSHTFNFQQGAMFQWLNRYDYRVIFNTLRGGNLVSIIKDPFNGKEIKTIPLPIQSINRNGTEALTLNYRRLFNLRPEYGYSVQAGNFPSNMAYEKDGIWKINIETGEYLLMITIADLIAINHRKEMDRAHHKINHIMYSPSGRKFIFMHRWICSHGKFSRLFMADNEGGNLKILLDDKMVSHYSWIDDNSVLAYARREPLGDKYYLINTDSLEYEIVGDGVLDIYGDGHPSYSPDKRWMITDTYPDKARMRYLILYDTIANRAKIIGRFFSPWKYDGYYRCDLHPRWSPDGKNISIDSTHEGFRGSYIVDLSDLIGGLH